MSTKCPYCNSDVSEALIEAEDGCCPECGAVIGAPSLGLGDEDSSDGDYEDEDVFSDLEEDDEFEHENEFGNETFDEDIGDDEFEEDMDEEELNDEEF